MLMMLGAWSKGFVAGSTDDCHDADGVIISLKYPLVTRGTDSGVMHKLTVRLMGYVGHCASEIGWLLQDGASDDYRRHHELQEKRPATEGCLKEGLTFLGGCKIMMRDGLRHIGSEETYTSTLVRPGRKDLESTLPTPFKFVPIHLDSSVAEHKNGCIEKEIRSGSERHLRISR